MQHNHASRQATAAHNHHGTDRESTVHHMEPVDDRHGLHDTDDDKPHHGGSAWLHRTLSLNSNHDSDFDVHDLHHIHDLHDLRSSSFSSSVADGSHVLLPGLGLGIGGEGDGSGRDIEGDRGRLGPSLGGTAEGSHRSIGNDLYGHGDGGGGAHMASGHSSSPSHWGSARYGSSLGSAAVSRGSVPRLRQQQPQWEDGRDSAPSSSPSRSSQPPPAGRVPPRLPGS